MEPRKIINDLGRDLWEFPCSICGVRMTSWSYRKGLTYRCCDCKESEKEEHRNAGVKPELRKLQAQRRLEIAEEVINRQFGNIGRYQGHVEWVSDNLDRVGWFQSSNEIIVALELMYKKVPTRHQVKMGKYRADFILPDMKVVLEIDGEHHKQKDVKERDKLKEAVMLSSLGPEWEVIHIKDELIKQNLKQLVPAIKKTVAWRKKMRKEYRGNIPDHVSECL